jgi:hypothetical protein
MGIMRKVKRRIFIGIGLSCVLLLGLWVYRASERWPALTPEQIVGERSQQNEALRQFLAALKSRDMPAIQNLTSRAAYSEMGALSNEEEFQNRHIYQDVSRAGLDGDDLADSWKVWQKWAELVDPQKVEWDTHSHSSLPARSLFVYFTPRPVRGGQILSSARWAMGCREHHAYELSVVSGEMGGREL